MSDRAHAYMLIRRRSPWMVAAVLVTATACLSAPAAAQTGQGTEATSGGQETHTETEAQQSPPTITELIQDGSPNIPLEDDPRFGLLSPIPSEGSVPLIYNELYGASAEELAYRAQARQYAQQIRVIVNTHFQSRIEATRTAGIDELRTFTDAAAFRALIEETADQADDVRLAVLDHLEQQDDMGQAALAWAAIYHEDEAMRYEATLRMREESNDAVLQVLDGALRSNTHVVANNAGMLAGSLNVLEAIPLLIFAQATRDNTSGNTGDLAWIAVGTQQAYVADLRAVVGSESGAFEPILGVLNEGSVLRVMDAVVVVYRTQVHQSLVNMTSLDWGQSTEHLGYNMNDWWNWYNNEYRTFKNEQILEERMKQQLTGEK